MASNVTAASGQDRPNILIRLWRDKQSRSVIIQIATVLLVCAFLAFMVDNAIQNLARLGKTFGFSFLLEPASYDINQRLIAYTSQDNHLRAMFVGILNTVMVATFGIVLATVLGFIFGVLRLSSNWLINKIVYCFVSTLR